MKFSARLLPAPALLRFALLSLVIGHGSLVMPARAAAPAAPVPTELRSEKLEMTSTDDETTAIATGNVILTGTNLRITCDHLTVIALRPKNDDKASAIPDAEKIKYILATGNVHITQADREATSQRAEVFPREDKVILSGGPVIIDNSNGMVATGEPLILLRAQRAVLGTNVKITAAPIEDLSANATPRATKPAAPSPTPATPAVTFPKPATR